jgi:hypothetical protein
MDPLASTSSMRGIREAGSNARNPSKAQTGCQHDGRSEKIRVTGAHQKTSIGKIYTAFAHANGSAQSASPSLRAHGSRECAPDDRLREAIQRQQRTGLLRRKAPRNDGKRRGCAVSEKIYAMRVIRARIGARLPAWLVAEKRFA